MVHLTELHRRKRIVGAIGAGVLALGVVGASAASLGGITSDSLGADVTTIASCDTDGVQLKPFTNAYDATAGRYQTSGVTVAGIAAGCATKSMSVTLKDAAGVSLGSATATVGGTSQAVTFSPTVNANAVVGAAVVISG
ncbi:MAG: hypothetical protein WBD02_01885 [Acidimicrobiia bacterium]